MELAANKKKGPGVAGAGRRCPSGRWGRDGRRRRARRSSTAAGPVR